MKDVLQGCSEDDNMCALGFKIFCKRMMQLAYFLSRLFRYGLLNCVYDLWSLGFPTIQVSYQTQLSVDN